MTVNRDKKNEIFLAVSSKDKKREISLFLVVRSKEWKYRADRMATRIVADIISK